MKMVASKGMPRRARGGLASLYILQTLLFHQTTSLEGGTGGVEEDGIGGVDEDDIGGVYEA